MNAQLKSRIPHWEMIPIVKTKQIKAAAKLRLVAEGPKVFKANQEAYFAESNPSRYAAQLKDRIVKKKGLYGNLETALDKLPEELRGEVESFVNYVDWDVEKKGESYWHDDVYLPSGLSHEASLLFDETMKVYDHADQENRHLVLKMVEHDLEVGSYKNDAAKLAAAMEFQKTIRPMHTYIKNVSYQDQY